MFQLDTEAASKVNGGGNRINESGIYKGKITRAEWSASNSSQAAFLNIDFKSDCGKEAKFMSICYQKGDGSKAFGYDTMMAIIATTKNRQVTSADYNGKKVCPELIDKPIALALQAEQDWYFDDQSGDYKPTTNMLIYVPFVYDTGHTAKELLSKLEPQTITRLVVNDRKPKDKPVQQSQGGFAPNQQSAPQGGASNPMEPPIDFDDDIPF